MEAIKKAEAKKIREDRERKKKRGENAFTWYSKSIHNCTFYQVSMWIIYETVLGRETHA